MNKYQDICVLLVDAGASVRGPLLERISCPLDIALSMEAADIIEILSPDNSDDEDAFIEGFCQFTQSPLEESEKSQTEKHIDRSSKSFCSVL